MAWLSDQQVVCSCINNSRFAVTYPFKSPMCDCHPVNSVVCWVTRTASSQTLGDLWRPLEEKQDGKQKPKNSCSRHGDNYPPLAVIIH